MVNNSKLNVIQGWRSFCHLNVQVRFGQAEIRCTHPHVMDVKAACNPQWLGFGMYRWCMWARILLERSLCWTHPFRLYRAPSPSLDCWLPVQNHQAMSQILWPALLGVTPAYLFQASTSSTLSMVGGRQRHFQCVWILHSHIPWWDPLAPWPHSLPLLSMGLPICVCWGGGHGGEQQWQWRHSGSALYCWVGLMTSLTCCEHSVMISSKEKNKLDNNF